MSERSEKQIVLPIDMATHKGKEKKPVRRNVKMKPRKRACCRPSLSLSCK